MAMLKASSNMILAVELDVKRLTECLQTFDNWIQGLFKDFQGQQQQFSRIYFKAWPPLPPLLAVRSSHKILYCHMILTFYKLITTMLVNKSNNILALTLFRLDHTCFAESAIAVKLN